MASSLCDPTLDQNDVRRLTSCCVSGTMTSRRRGISPARWQIAVSCKVDRAHHKKGGTQMRRYASITLPLLLALLWGCSRTVLVSVPPRMDLRTYGTVGIVEFASNSERAINAHATRQFQEQIQAAQPGTRFIELGDRDAELAAVAPRQLQPTDLRNIGGEYGDSSVFLGDVDYFRPRNDAKITEIRKLQSLVRT